MKFKVVVGLIVVLIIYQISRSSYKYGYTVRDAEAKKDRLVLIDSLNKEKTASLNKKEKLRNKESLKARKLILGMQQKHKVELSESIKEASKNSNCKRVGDDVVELFRNMHEGRAGR